MHETFLVCDTMCETFHVFFLGGAVAVGVSQVYIWSRPPGSGMRAGKLSRDILYNMGITDGAVSDVGRVCFIPESAAGKGRRCRFGHVFWVGLQASSLGQGENMVSFVLLERTMIESYCCSVVLCRSMLIVVALSFVSSRFTFLPDAPQRAFHIPAFLRPMVHSPPNPPLFVQCKIIGRRNKYSMIYAMFDALAKHRGIESIARGRGKRILSLQREMAGRFA